MGPDGAARAVSLFREATTLDSTYFPAWIGLGMTELSTGALSDAAISFDRAQRLKPDNLDAVAGRAQALLALGQIDAAVPLVERLGTANVRLLWETGNRLVRLGRGKDALPLLDSAASAESPSAAGWALLSLADAEANETQKSMTAAAAAERDPDSERPEVQVMLAKAMATDGQVGAARALGQHALRLDSSSVEAKELLARLNSAPNRRP
jgi:cytochrome c-type biogenesis protein CcmH/NrfG